MTPLSTIILGQLQSRKTFIVMTAFGMVPVTGLLVAMVPALATSLTTLIGAIVSLTAIALTGHVIDQRLSPAPSSVPANVGTKPVKGGGEAKPRAPGAAGGDIESTADDS